MDCEYCLLGDEPEVLDEDGVLSSITHKPGSWAHGVNDDWVLCWRKAAEEHAEVVRLRTALAPFATAAPHMTCRKRDPVNEGIWRAPDGSCRLSVADFQRAAETKGGE